MDVSGSLDAVSRASYVVGVQKLAQDQQKVDGQAAVRLIEDAQAASSPGLEGQGTRIDTYA